MYGGKEYNAASASQQNWRCLIDAVWQGIQMFAVDADHFTITAHRSQPHLLCVIATFGRRVKILP